MKWRRNAYGWLSADGRWSVRGPIMGKPMWWLYHNGSRYTETGRYQDAVSFTTSLAARRFAARIATRMREET